MSRILLMKWTLIFASLMLIANQGQSSVLNVDEDSSASSFFKLG